MIDPAASAALDGDFTPVFLMFIDFVNEPQRVNTSGANVLFTGTGEPDIDGFTFSGLSANVVDIGPVANSATGTEELKVSLSGFIELEPEMFDEINDRAKWQGREVRLWIIIRTMDGTQQGLIQHYYTGYLSRISIPTSPESITIDATVEGYLAAHSEPANRTYLSQEQYDVGDLSARATVAAANGSRSGPVVNIKNIVRGLFK